MTAPLSRLESVVTAYAEWLLGHRVLVLLLALASVVGLAAGVRHLTFSTDYRVYFGPENPQLQAFEELQNVYTRNDITLAMFEARGGGDVFQPRVLEAVREFTAEAWTLPYTTRVDSITNFQHSEAAGNDLAVGPLLPAGAPLTPERIARLRAITLNEPVLLNRLIAPDGRATGVSVTANFPQQSQREVPEAVLAARALRDRIEARYPEVRIAFIGTNAFNYAFTEASQADRRTLIPAMYVLITVITWLLLRSGWATAATVLLIAISTATAMGIAGYLRVGLTPPAMVAPIVITTLAVADSLHLFLCLFAAQREGRARHDAIAEALRLNFTPIFLTSITTAIGFLTINFSDSPPLRDFGNIAAVGVMMAWVYSIVLVPVLMAVLPIRTPAHRPSRVTQAMVRLCGLVVRYRTALLWGGVVLTLAALAGIPRNRVNDNFLRYFDTSLEFRQDAERVVERLTGTFALEFSLKAEGPQGIADPAYLRDVEAFAQWWRANPQVAYVSTITDTFKRLNRNMHGDDPAYYRLPEDRELAAQYLLLYEMSLPFGLDLDNTVNIDKSATRFVAVLDGHVTTAEIQHAIAAGEAWLRQNAPAIATQASGTNVMFASIARRNLDSMLAQMPLSIAIIWVLLLLTLRSLRVGLLALLPLAAPVGVAFGIWGYVDGWLNFTMAVALGVVTGIVDDDTVHFLNHYLRGRRQLGLSGERALRYAFETAGTALLSTSAILIGGFVLLAQSAFLPHHGMSSLAAIAIAVALAFNLFLIPPILLRIDRAPAIATLKETSHDAAPA